MLRRPPTSTLMDTSFPYTSRVLSDQGDAPDKRVRGDPAGRGVQRRGADQAEHEARAIAADGEVAVGGVELVEDAAVAVQQQRAQAVELDLLGMVLARQH